MRKGQLRSPVPILLSALIILCLLSAGALYAKRSERAVGPLLPVNGLSLVTSDPAARPIFGHTLPTPPIMMREPVTTRQASGPDPDDNLTPSATGTTEVYPNASPGSTQNRIVFCSNGEDADGNGQIDATLPTDPDYDIWIMRSDGSEQYKVKDMAGDQVDPVYDPGGRLICFASKVSGVWQIFTLEVADPTIVTQITTGAGNKRHPTWSPDSNYIAFQSDVNGNWDIYKVISTGSDDPVQLTPGATNDTDPAWSTDGSVIAFTRENAGLSRIYSVTPDAADVEQLSDGGDSATVNDKQPAWRQNSADIAFASDRPVDANDTTADFNIWTMGQAGEANGAAATLISNTAAGNTDTADDTDPTWTLEIDSTPLRICFTSTRDGSPDIWAMQQDDQVPPLLTALPTVVNRLATPGDDVTISVPVYDKASNIQQVMAYIKDPDQKEYLVTSGESFDVNYTDGERWLETDCTRVGQCELFDDDGDGTFEGTWTTEAIAGGRDYIIDIMVTDDSGNSLTYDDIYGFSTHMFSPTHNILFVDDYCEGQSFLALLGWNNDYCAAFPVESYYTYNPSTYPTMASSIDHDTISDCYANCEYDTWRILCRGAVPASVYQYYLPTIEYQLDPAKLDDEGSLGVTADRAVPVADRAVVWASPHTGDLWIADGGIMDASTQAAVASFVQRGGRLFICGEDLAWALTMNGTRTNTFLANTLRANFVSDNISGNVSLWLNYLGQTWRIQNTSLGFGLTGLANDVVAQDAWGTAGGHAGDLEELGNWRASCDDPIPINSSWNFMSPPSGTPQSDFHDCSDWSMRPDAIEANGSIKIYGATAGNNTSNFGGLTVGVRYADAGLNGGTVVYLSAGFEQFNRGYHTSSQVSAAHCRNTRSHLMHNALCWARTGGFQGRVVSISDGGQAVNDPAPIVSALDNGEVVYAVRCQTDGTYIMQGLAPGHYVLEASRPGYEIDHYDAQYVHGGQIPRTVDFAIKRAQPGAVTGKVTSAATGDPLAGVTMSIAVPDDYTGTVPTLPSSVKTGADGSYTLGSIPEGSYVVTADGTAILYGKKSQDVTVNAGDTTTADFQLDAADGTLEVTVTDAETADTIRNAAVVIVSAASETTTVYTDDAGFASTALAPGTYTVTASASGYQASASQTVTIAPAATETLAFALQPQPGGSIVGRVVTSGSGAFVSGVTIHVFFGEEEIASTTTSGSVVKTIGGVQYNYEIADVDTGTVTVTAEASGFTPTPTSRTVQIESGVTATGVNFAMDSLHTFPTGLQLVSFPWDYSGEDPQDLLGLTSSTWKMATWQTGLQSYAMYPEAPADHFRIGTGYWMNLSAKAELSQEGLAADDPVTLPLDAGWNLIGCPYRKQIDIYTAKIKEGGVTYTLQQALSEGIVGSSLYVYMLGGYQTVGVLSPYTGYWLKTNAPCSLILSESSGALAAGTQVAQTTPEVSNGWLLRLKTKVGEMQDTATYLGWASGATDGCDFALDEFKPPAPTMGPYVYTAIDNRDWAKNPGDYAVDVRPSGISSTWDLTVYTNQVGARVALTWDDLSSLPNTVRPVLTDTLTGRRVYMRTTTGFVFEASNQPRKLTLTVAATGVGQLTISPQVAAQTSAGVAISYTLSRPASVEANITNMAGRRIRQITTAATQTAGVNTLLWDARDKRGLRVPSGRYLVTVTARTESGQECRAVLPLSIQSR